VRSFLDAGAERGSRTCQSIAARKGWHGVLAERNATVVHGAER
jgi:hypothetical protein